MNETINKFLSRRKVLKLSATFFGGCLILLSSCKKETTTIGDSLQDQSLDLKTIDTFTVVTYSDELDSMESDETAASLLGEYLDPEFGHVDCGIVTEILPSSVNPDLGTSASTVVDSVVLAFRYSSILKYGDIQDMTFEVFEITDDLERDDQVYHTFDDPTTTGSNLMLPGAETQLPDVYEFQIVGDDTLNPQLRLHLDPSLGDAFVVANEGGDLSSDDAFTSYFNGLYIKVTPASLSEGDGAILYFSLESGDSKLTMYFHDSATPTQLEEFDFDINSQAARYNKITYDRTGTDVEALLADPSLGENEFYMQAGAIRAIIELPHIEKFAYDSLGQYDPKIINRAELFLPVQDFEPDPFNPASDLFIAKAIDKKTSDFILDNNFAATLGISNTVQYNTITKEFSFLMTREVQAIMGGNTENGSYRIYSPNFFASSVERIIFNGSNSPLKKRPRLEITYTEY